MGYLSSCVHRDRPRAAIHLDIKAANCLLPLSSVPMSCVDDPALPLVSIPTALFVFDLSLFPVVKGGGMH